MTEQPQGMSLQEALAQLAALEDYMGRLQTLITALEQRIARLTETEDAIQMLDENTEIMASVDGAGEVYFKAKPVNPDKLLIHLGLDLYAELPREKALDLIRDERAKTARLLDNYRRELMSVAQYYQNLRAAVEQAVEAARRAQQGQRKR